MISAPCRFDAETHVYRDERGVVPNITSLLERAGLSDPTWYTLESRVRGRAVHHLTAEYDTGVLEDDDLDGLESLYKGYLLAHVKSVRIYGGHWQYVETPAVHPTFRFGGRPDRVGLVYSEPAVAELKSGAVEKAHQIQTALQAILVADTLELPAERVNRWACYLQANGRFQLFQHKGEQDFREARRIIAKFCR